MKLFVGNIAFDTTDDELLAHFAAYGATSAEALQWTDTGRARGFGYVFIPDSDQAQAAITALDGSQYKGRRIGVEIAKPKRAA